MNHFLELDTMRHNHGASAHNTLYADIWNPYVQRAWVVPNWEMVED
jgi:hypothetical protein